MSRTRFSSCAAVLRVAALLAAAACRTTEPATDATLVAKAGDQTLTAATLSVPFGQSRRTLRIEEVRAAADLWLDYQLLARAVASMDTLRDPSIVEDALWGPIANAKARKWYQLRQPTWPLEPTNPEELYRAGQILTAKQILLDVPQRVTPFERTVIRGRVDSLRQQLTPENFSRVASRISADSLSRNAGGQLPAWPAGRNLMLPVFEQAIQLTKPGSISGIIATEFGVHIVYRPTWAEAERLVRPAVAELVRFRAESTYFHALETTRSVVVLPGVAALARTIAQRPDLYADSTTVLATIRGGDFTAATLVRWLRAYPPTEGISTQLTTAPDTLVPNVLRRIIRNELFVRQADSAGITITVDERRGFEEDLRLQIESAVGTLGFARRMVPDSIWALTTPQRQAFFATRANAQFASIVRGIAAPVQVTPSLRQLLRARYPDATIDAQGLQQALDHAITVRMRSDTAAAPKPADTTRAVPASAPTKP